jgi:WD40 repeat protein
MIAALSGTFVQCPVPPQLLQHQLQFWLVEYMDCVLLQCRDGDLPESLARKLELSAVLNGHTGCVNRLAWNQDGSLLASASDDCQVRLRNCWLSELLPHPVQSADCAVNFQFCRGYHTQQ